MGSKNKEAKAAIEQEIRARVEEEVAKRLSGEEVAEASDDADVEEALDNAEATTSEIPNNNEAQASAGTTFKDKFAAAFSRDNILS